MDAHRPGARLEAPVKGNQGRRRPPGNVRYWHKADIDADAEHVRFGGKADIPESAR